MVRKQGKSHDDELVLQIDASGDARWVLDEDGKPVPLCPVENPTGDPILPSCSDDRRVVVWIRVQGDETSVEVRRRTPRGAWESWSFREDPATPAVDVVTSPDGRYVIWSAWSFNDPDFLSIVDLRSSSKKPRCVIPDADVARALHWLGEDTLGFISDDGKWNKAGGLERMTNAAKAKLIAECEVHALRVSTGKPVRWPPLPDLEPSRKGSQAPPADRTQWITHLEGPDIMNPALSRFPVELPFKKWWTYKLPSMGCSLVAGSGRVIVGGSDGSLVGLDLGDGSELWRKNDCVFTESPEVRYAAGRVLVRTEGGMQEVTLDGTFGKSHAFKRIRYAGDKHLYAVGGGLVSRSDLSPTFGFGEETPVRLIDGDVGLCRLSPTAIQAQDLKTGKVLWKEESRARLEHFGVFRNKLLYLYRPTSARPKGGRNAQDLVCRDVETGEIHWALPIRTSMYDSWFWIVETDKQVRLYPTIDQSVAKYGDAYVLPCYDFVTGEEIPGESLRLDLPELRELVAKDREGDWAPEVMAMSPGAIWVHFRSWHWKPDRNYLLALELPSGDLLWKCSIAANIGLPGFADSCLLAAHGSSLTCYGSKPSRTSRRR